MSRSGLGGYGLKSAEGPLCECTKLLIRPIDALPNDGHIWVLLWGGANVLAQARLTVKNSRSEDELEKFAAKLRFYAISDQDDYRPWIRLHFPKLFNIASIHVCKISHLLLYRATSG